MRPIRLFAILAALISGCSKGPPPVSPQTARLPPRLDSYFEAYCDYTGALGIQFVPSHAYDYRFRQHLKKTQDPEAKRLFVLQNLHQAVEFALIDFEAGIIRTGKTSSRPLTLPEWRSTQQRIVAMIDDLAAYTAFTNFAVLSLDPLDRSDPRLDAMWIEELRERLQGVTNAPAANTSVEPTADAARFTR